MSRLNILGEAGSLGIAVGDSLSGASGWAKKRLAYEQARPLLNLMPSLLEQLKERKQAGLNDEDDWVGIRKDEELLSMVLADLAQMPIRRSGPDSSDNEATGPADSVSFFL